MPGPRAEPPLCSDRSAAPTNRQVAFSGIEIDRMVDGKVDEHWFQFDGITLLQQLGMVVMPGPRLLPQLPGSTQR